MPKIVRMYYNNCAIYSIESILKEYIMQKTCH
nr:MAG TPA: hypothetical protein [Caudoviricetes sp.]